MQPYAQGTYAHCEQTLCVPQPADSESESEDASFSLDDRIGFIGAGASVHSLLLPACLKSTDPCELETASACSAFICLLRIEGEKCGTAGTWQLLLMCHCFCSQWARQ